MVHVRMHLWIGMMRQGAPGERVGEEDRVYAYLGGVCTRGLAIPLHTINTDCWGALVIACLPVQGAVRQCDGRRCRRTVRTYVSAVRWPTVPPYCTYVRERGARL